MSLQSIKDVDNYKKNSDSNAIVSVDNKALAAYKVKKQKQTAILTDINNIKLELNEIKHTLMNLNNFLLSQNNGNK